jgi:hypothetical protein
MVRSLGWTTRRFGAGALVLYFAWHLWDVIGPAKPQVSRARQEIADQLLPVIVDDLRQNRGEPRSAIFLHFANDPSNYVSDQLRQAIASSAILDIDEHTFDEKMRQALHLRQREWGDSGQAAAEARARGVPAAIWGDVHTFESTSHGAILDLEVHLVDAESGKDLFSKRYKRDDSGSPIEDSLTSMTTSAAQTAQKASAWLVAVLLLPAFTSGFVRSMVRKESNGWNAAALAVYTLADVLLAVVIAGEGKSAFAWTLSIMGSAAAALTYNVFVMSQVARAER